MNKVAIAQNLLAIVAAVNSAGNTLTVEEARGIIADLGGDPDWAERPPEWIGEINRAVRSAMGGCDIREER